MQFPPTVPASLILATEPSAPASLTLRDVVTLALGLVGGAGLTLATTWWRITHERREAFRTRRIEAAVDFLASLGEARSSLHAMNKHTTEAVRLGADVLSSEYAQVKEKSRDASENVDRRLDEARHHAARITLLFPPDSGVQEAAAELIHALGSLRRELRQVVPLTGNFPDETTAADEWEAAAVAEERFARLGRDAIQRVG